MLAETPYPTFERLDDRAALVQLLAHTMTSGAAAAADELLHRFGDFRRTLSADLADLAPVVEPETALDLRRVYDAACRLVRSEVSRRDVLSSWPALLAYLKLTMGAREREAFRVIFLDKKNQIIADEVLGEGTVDHAPVYPREVIRRALVLSASAMILVHNHPSGDPTPSSADVEMTRQVVAAALTLCIAVHDHVFVGREQVASFRALGLI